MFVKRLQPGWLLVFMLAISTTLQAELPAETRWADPSSVQLNVEFPGMASTSRTILNTKMRWI